MRVAVLGPICKDYIKIDNDLKLQIGGIPYYIAHTLKNLGVEEVIPFITFNKNDEEWVKDNFKNINFIHIPAKKTLEFSRLYYSKNPDECVSIEIKYSPNVISLNKELLETLEKFDYIILSPLFNDNIPEEMFKKLKHKNLVLGNFGMFTYPDNGEFTQRNPEKLVKLLSYLKYLFLDLNEAKFVSGIKGDIKKIGSFFIKNGVENMIITEGSRGSHLFINNKYYKIPAFSPNKIVDPTGAGDTYLSAFIKSLELYRDPAKQGKFAAMVATMSLEDRGAFKDTVNDVKRRLNN